MDKLNIFLVKKDIFVKDAMRQMDKNGGKVLFVVDNDNKLLGSLTDGDIRRYILSGRSLDNDIREVYNRKPAFIKRRDFSPDLAKEMIIKRKIELLPILEEDDRIADLITAAQLFFEDKAGTLKAKEAIDIPVIIMAGGKGTRLDPFTKILPKALIPIGDKPVIEIIIDEFRKQGVNEYYLTLNHKGRMIESYFNNIKKDYKMKYIWEDDFLGTAGSLKLLERHMSDIFIVSNSDVIVKADIKDVINSHKKKNALITVISSIQHHKVPYGVISFKEEGEIKDILEKPEYTFLINTGVYILSKESLQFIPEKSQYHMTDLIKKLIKNNKKNIIYPINENDYIDIGQWEEYRKATEKLKLLGEF